MKKIGNILIYFLVASLFLVSCDSILDVDSKRLVSADEFGNSSNDSLYSTFGILYELQKLGDSYVLLGELRGDLLTVTDESDLALKEINNFNISSDNKYVNINDYYSVINNCNYILKHIDSTQVDNGIQKELKQYAAIKSIRAWTYMQLVLNFKTAKYYEDPILTVEDSKKTYPEYDFDELADVLIKDLEPLKDVDFPKMGYVGSYYLGYSYFPIRFILGDLYLWKGDYLDAAKSYYELMYKNRYCIYEGYSSTWETTESNTVGNTATLNWIYSFSYGNSECISCISCPTEYGQEFDLDSLNMQHKIVPSQIAINNWDDQTYFLNDAANTEGDLRKYGSVWWHDEVTSTSKNVTTYEKGDDDATQYYIMKYMKYNQNIVVYRTSLLYLRYAEAVNRLNKPQLAFSVLKYGLNNTNYYDEDVFPTSEKDSLISEYAYFNDSRFSNNVGIRMRGCGNADQDTLFYRFEPQASMEDSVLYVEDLIQKELALETAFEGNRFHDLMRITLRRIKNGEGDASYLADKVAAKHVGNETEFRTKLMDTDNWYLEK